MKQINKEFEGKGEVKGITFTQIKRKGLVCIYKRSDGYYEVIKLKHQKENTVTIAGQRVHFEEKEVYSTGDSWDGKCVKLLETAEKHFKQMSKQ